MRPTRPAGRRGARALRPAVLTVLVGWGLVAAAGAAGTAGPGAAEQQRLAAGEIVVIDTLPPGASPSAQGGTAIAVVRAPVDRVWSILVDYRGHPRFYPRVVTAEVLETSQARALVRYVIRIGFLSFTFHMSKVADPVHRRIDWHLAEGRANSLLRENSGYWRVEPRGSDSLVTYAIAVRTILPGFLTARSERESLAETIGGLRRVATGRPDEPAGR